MAKRTLGLGKAAKQRKKQKSDSSEQSTTTREETPTKSNEIHVELDDEVDADDELIQLKGLWDTYIQSDRENELVLNGIIHECDRLLRNQNEEKKEGDTVVKLSPEFHSIYALALSELAIFHTEDEGEGRSVKDYFDAALERIELGQDAYPDSVDLQFSKARIILNRIPLEYISKWNLLTEKDELKGKVDLVKLLDEALLNYDKASETIKLLENYSLLNDNVFEILNALDDLLDIIKNFGKEDSHAEGLDSDAEDDEFEEEGITLSKKHPLYKLSQNREKYFKWLIKNAEQFGDLIIIEHKSLLDKKPKDLTTREAKQLSFLKNSCVKLGQLLLTAAEKPSQIFTTITYESDVEDDAVIDGYSSSKAQKEAIQYTEKAIEFFEVAEDEEDPQTWVDVAEAVIDLGNLYDYESKEQEEMYGKAEKRLRRANNATNGKFQKVLDNLLEKDDE